MTYTTAKHQPTQASNTCIPKSYTKWTRKQKIVCRGREQQRLWASRSWPCECTARSGAGGASHCARGAAYFGSGRAFCAAFQAARWQNERQMSAPSEVSGKNLYAWRDYNGKPGLWAGGLLKGVPASAHARSAQVHAPPVCSRDVPREQESHCSPAPRVPSPSGRVYPPEQVAKLLGSGARRPPRPPYARASPATCTPHGACAAPACCLARLTVLALSCRSWQWNSARSSTVRHWRRVA